MCGIVLNQAKVETKRVDISKFSSLFACVTPPLLVINFGKEDTTRNPKSSNLWCISRDQGVQWSEGSYLAQKGDFRAGKIWALKQLYQNSTPLNLTIPSVEHNTCDVSGQNQRFYFFR